MAAIESSSILNFPLLWQAAISFDKIKQKVWKTFRSRFLKLGSCFFAWCLQIYISQDGVSNKWHIGCLGCFGGPNAVTKIIFPIMNSFVCILLLFKNITSCLFVTAIYCFVKLLCIFNNIDNWTKKAATLYVTILTQASWAWGVLNLVNICIVDTTVRVLTSFKWTFFRQLAWKGPRTGWILSIESTSFCNATLILTAMAPRMCHAPNTKIDQEKQ